MSNISIFNNGASIIADFITKEKETALIENIDKQPWQHDLRRRVQHYGYKYNYRSHNAAQATTPLPPWAISLASKLQSLFNNKIPEQCIINEYLPGQGIGMHTDITGFGPIVASLSLLSAWPIHFRAPGTLSSYNRLSVPTDEQMILPQRSLLVLTGQARYKWMHGIDPNNTRGLPSRRISTTFRTLR